MTHQMSYCVPFETSGVFPTYATHSLNSLMKKAKDAYVGINTQTVYDPSIRKSLEIKLPPKVHASIQREYDFLANRLMKKMDFDTPVTAQRYNVLLYTKGCFFKPHRDVEKAPGMVATMIVTAPSDHTGGDLIINHGGQSYVFKSSENNQTQKGVIFYADCLHEVTPITSGIRIVTTYKIIAQ